MKKKALQVGIAFIVLFLSLPTVVMASEFWSGHSDALQVSVNLETLDEMLQLKESINNELQETVNSQSEQIIVLEAEASALEAENDSLEQQLIESQENLKKEKEKEKEKKPKKNKKESYEEQITEDSSIEEEIE